MTINLSEFEKVDIRVGKVIECRDFPEGKYSTHILIIDFGVEIGTKKSLAKLKPNYNAEEMVDKLVLCVVNFKPIQIGKHMSEVLTLGVPDKNNNVILITPQTDVPIGGKLY